MKIQTFDKITQLTIHPWIFPMNCYVVEEENELILIDAFRKKDAQKLIAYLTKQSKPLKHLLITHAHSDHVGDVAALAKAFPNLNVALSEKEYHRIIDATHLSKLTPLSQKPDFLLAENIKIGSLEVLETPGHTAGSLSFYRRASQQIIVGDLVQTRGRSAIAGDKVRSFPFPYFGTENGELAKETVTKLAMEENKYPIKQIFCGHGEAASSWQSFINKEEK